ncbi:SRPBCC domain-containing protein [Leifsonia sp. PS1209]|uniref:SRPBCC domain-containing protein n=1 Tax=Leifsonia sp. PS1209 TaxID=2724914 RepID=UPI001442E525|nr:SRPBCC domain-containing protein [Leifsonia sp. PS1209]QIZ97896.1 helix-turn-helix domain-containing protein [Leifsonia sp. PS1209]
MDVQQALAAIGEPTRFHILTVLADGPRTVGEVAAAVGGLQPQTTKHVQALEAVGVLRVQRLGRRKLASLNRDALAQLAEWFGSMAAQTPDDRALEEYAHAVDAAERGASGATFETEISMERRLDASPESVWRAWTEAASASQWWAPRHFEVVRCAIDAVPCGRVQLVIREGDGTEYASAGSVLSVEPSRRLVFELSPVDGEGRRLFTVVVDVTLEGGADTALRLTIRADGPDAGTAAMRAGLELGWSQQLDRLQDLLSAPAQ